MYPIRVINI